MTQMYFLTCCGESECHNRRKLPPRSHKPDLLLQEVQVSRGNIPLFYSVKILDPTTATVYSRSESERSSGGCPPLLRYQKTRSETRRPWQEASISTLSSEVVFWIVSWGKPGEGEVTLCQVIASQAWFGWRRSCYDSRNLRGALRPRSSAPHQTTGHPLCCKVQVLLNPNAQCSPLTMLTKSPVRVRFMLNSQSSKVRSPCCPEITKVSCNESITVNIFLFCSVTLIYQHTKKHIFDHLCLHRGLEQWS